MLYLIGASFVKQTYNIKASAYAYFQYNWPVAWLREAKWGNCLRAPSGKGRFGPDGLFALLLNF